MLVGLKLSGTPGFLLFEDMSCEGFGAFFLGEAADRTPGFESLIVVVLWVCGLELYGSRGREFRSLGFSRGVVATKRKLSPYLNLNPKL